MSHAAIAYAHENRDRFLDDLKELLSIPSISALPEHRRDLEQAAAWIEHHLTGIGIGSEIISGDGHPLVYGEWLGAPGSPTILVYGHYDVQPVDPLDLWISPPFEPVVRDDKLYARGASDDKGQTMTLLCAAESLLRTRGRLPVNLKFLIEGEEENGSAFVSAYVRQHGDRLRADVAQIADTSMFASGIPMLETGLRGILYTEVHARGAAHDLHSGQYGGVAPNPLNALAHLIAALKDESGTITIPHFYDDVHMPEEEVLVSWRALPFDPEALRQEEIGSSTLVGEAGFTPLERMWVRPTLDVHGISGGFTSAGAKTVIPAEASAKISMRLVPDQQPQRIFELYRRRAIDLASPGIELDVQLVHSAEPVVIPTDSSYVVVAREALRETFRRAVVLGRSGGSIPIVGTLKESLGINSILMGWGLPDDNLHAPNEKLSLDNFHRGIDATVRFWEALGAMGASLPH